MQRLEFTNARGETAVFDFAAPYVFWKADGLSAPPVSPVISRASGQNGYTLHGIQAGERVIRLTAHVHGRESDGQMYAERRRLNAILNPLLGLGELRYENDAGAYIIPAYARGIPYLSKIPGVQTLSAEFECPSPFWRAEEGKTVLLSYVDGGLEFPLETPNVFGIMGYSAELDIDADAPVPVEIFIEGGADHPVITLNPGGEFIRIARDIPDYATVYINTDGEKSEVRIMTPQGAGAVKTENAYGWLTLDSTLFQLKPGQTNELVFTSDDDTLKTRIKINYRELYSGV